ncbi:MAG: DUF5686 and carboxypeptidase regulatory-like domain-containing protein [Tannerellaceae bacterium]|jgi:hypothetical protein|nr:DUF5686 and carboxypeptidase regulatory-like domain-containing protein [Tannerellaceae bacterium]
MYARFRYWILFAVLYLPATLPAQRATVAEGTVRDSTDGRPLAYVSLLFEGSTLGTSTDEQGRFRLQSSRDYSRLSVYMLGYETKTVSLRAGTNKLDILLSPASYQLQDIEIRPGRERYTRRNNPAVDLIRQVIAHKNDNRMESVSLYKTEVYDKLSLALDYTPQMERLLSKPFATIKNYIDTSSFTGKPVLTLSVRESLADYYYRKDPRDEKTLVKAQRQLGVDQTLDESGTISANLREIFRDINLFDNDIPLLINRFVSPLSSTLATTYYKYYILDTLDISGDPCVSLAFAPVNSQSYSFTGLLYVMLDGSYAIRKAQLNAPRLINLNWVNQLRIEQEFMRTPAGWALANEQTYATFAPLPGTPQLYAHRLRSFSDYDFAPPAGETDSIFRLSGAEHILPQAGLQTEAYWEQNRHIPLAQQEDKLDKLLDELRQIPLFRVLIKGSEILIADYIATHPQKEKSRFDFGPMGSTFSTNYLEGLRLRIGGMTTANLHPQWFATAYLAYGNADRRLKYHARLTHSFSPKDYHEKEFTVHNLSLTHEYDVSIPGRRFLYTDHDNIALSLNVGGTVTKMQYIRKTELRYEKEWRNNLSVSLWAKHENNEAAGALSYLRHEADGSLTPLDAFSSTEAGIQLRYAPGEKPYNGRKGRSSVFNLSKDAPIFSLSHQVGLGSAYDYQHTEGGVEKRIWLSSFGHIDAIWRAGYQWSRVPFPLLILPNANPSITIRPETFSMMRPLEFVADRYTSLFLTYYMKGWILNRIPLVQWLGLREVVSVSALYGGLSDKNNPLCQPEGLFALPEGSSPIGRTPYIEASLGLDNIFRVLRIDYYRRLTYLDKPQTNKYGIRLGLRFSF